MKCKTITEVGDSKAFDIKMSDFLTGLVEKHCQVKEISFNHSVDYFCASIVYVEPFNK